MEQVPHLNALHRKYETKGLSVIGVTGESEELTEPWVQKHGMEFAYGYHEGLPGFFGVSALPYAVLINSQGNIVWKGHPAGLKEEFVKIALRGSLQPGLYQWPAEAEEVKQALMARRYGPAFAAAKGLDPSYTKRIRLRMNHLVGSMERAKKRGDFLLAKELALRVFRQCEGLAPQEQARDLLRELKSNAEHQRVIAAQLRLRKLVLQVVRLGDLQAAKEVLAKMRRLQGQEAHNAAGRQAKREVLILKERIELGR